MALPREPRQKMINMMYLVLTALLALNVSSEILNAFKTVNRSLETTNVTVNASTVNIMKSLQDKTTKPETAERALRWYPKAEQVQALSTKTYTYIQGLKDLILREAGGDPNNKEKSFKEDNLDIATRLMVEKGEGKKLYTELENYRNNVLKVDPLIQQTFANSLQIDLSKPPTKNKGNNTWEAAYFRMVPTVAALTILSKFQNDVKNSEAQVVDFAHKQIGEVEVVFDEFQAFAGTNSTYLMPGQELEITAGVGAFSKAARPNVSVNGAAVPLGADGTAVYKTTVSGAGEKTVNVKVNFTKPDGTPATVDRTIKYTVGVPSGASVFLEKMNVVYIGVENPVMVSAGSAGKEKMNVSFTGGSITPAGGDRYIIKPTKAGPAEIKVTVEGKTSSFPMRCKNLPDPTAMVGASKGGSMPAATFKAMGGVLAKLMDSEFDAKYEVLSYVVGANGGAFPNYQQAPNEGARWAGGAAAIIGRATPG